MRNNKHYSLRPETIEAIIATQQAPVPPSTIESRVQVLQSIIENSVNWRGYCFVSGKVSHARTTAIMIGRKRAELRLLKAGM